MASQGPPPGGRSEPGFKAGRLRTPEELAQILKPPDREPISAGRQGGPQGTDLRVGQLRSPGEVAQIMGAGPVLGAGLVLKNFALAAAGGTGIRIGSRCWIEFFTDKVVIDCFGSDVEDVPYHTIEELQVSGSTIRSNAGVFGGGFGIIGAVEGVLAATVINRLTTRTRQYAVLRIVTNSAEYVFASNADDGSALALALTSVQVAIRKARQANGTTPSAPRPSPVSVADELAKLAHLRDAGILTDDEFANAKARLLGG